MPVKNQMSKKDQHHQKKMTRRQTLRSLILTKVLPPFDFNRRFFISRAGDKVNEIVLSRQGQDPATRQRRASTSVNDPQTCL